MPKHHPALPHRGILLGFAAIPSFDCIVNQLNNVFHISLGSLSMLQVLRGYATLVFFAVTGWALLKDHAGLRRIPLPALACLLMLGMAVTKEILVSGGLAMQSAVAYGQMSYWLLFWIAVSVLCVEPRQAEIILWGLGIGATLTAVSVLAGLAFGGLNYYDDDGVRSSSGWFDTSKYITGVLVCGTLVLLYLGRKRGGWLHPLLALLCSVACLVTYARAGSVALAAVVLWLAAWYVLFGREGKRRWLRRFLVLTAAGVLLVPLAVKSDTLFARWNDLGDPDKAGSGRASFWRLALDSYVDATPAEQAVGSGFNAMAEMLYRATGSDIKHCHNDMLDVMLVAGVAGVAWLLSFIGSMAWRIGKTSLWTLEGATGTGILLAYVLHGQFTGQLWSVDAMSYNCLSLSCLFVLGSPSLRPAVPARAPLPPEDYPRSLAGVAVQTL